MSNCRHVKITEHGIFDCVNNGKCEECGATFYSLQKEISLLKKEKAVLLEAVEAGGDYEISGMAKVDFVLLRDSLRDTLEKLKEIRE